MNSLEIKVGTMPTALDLCLAAMAIIHVLGGTIPWYVWTAAALELIVVISAAVRIKSERDQ
jgi:hypothetical protein